MLFLLAGGYFARATPRLWVTYRKPEVKRRDDLALIVAALLTELEA